MKALVVIPTLNEATVIEKNLQTVILSFSSLLKNYEWQILVADNGSTDDTVALVQKLAAAEPKLTVWHTDKKGRGQALRTVWLNNEADIYAYMDADLATDLAFVPLLFQTLDKADIAIGTRLQKKSKTSRSFFRELSSRVYNTLVRQIISLKISDTQCGFKAIKKEVAQKILPLTTHEGWFFDTELLALANLFSFKIKELPVQWNETPDGRRKSSVKVLATAWDDIVHLIKLRKKIRQLKKSLIK